MAVKQHNFCSGPAMLPTSVFEAASRAITNLDGSGLSILEISHRSEAFQAIMDEARARVKQLAGLNDDYHVLFLQGGASSQFYMVPMNLLPTEGTAAYLNTGVWSKKAIAEAGNFGQTQVVGSSEDKQFRYVPKDYSIIDGTTYFHYTTNNTIYGTQVKEIPETAVPLIGDMSSDIFSRPFDYSKFGLIYAGAQKNIGPAGTTVVIVNEKLLNGAGRKIPTMLDYRTHIEKGSMLNTPPTFAVYCCMLTLRWLEENGGLKEMEKRNNAKAAKLYSEIDDNPLFVGNVNKEDRSLMNVTFSTKNPADEAAFLKFAAEENISGIKGHRSVGGLRASIYNAMPMESVEVLCAAMQKFATINA